ncbi:MAG: glycosyltransferase, partial [Myxococcota bacterium]|nr:glycosyltransferase [Myxococcota bacterium]
MDQNTPEESNDAIDVSVVIPIYNEEGILSASVADLTSKIANLPDWNYEWELILSENGSTDSTVELARSLNEQNPHHRQHHTQEPNNGHAKRRGILP